MVHKVRASFALLLLTLFLVSGAAQAASSRPAVQERTPGLLTAVWDWVASLVETRLPFLSIHEASEVIIPTSPPSGPNTDAGPFIDPGGHD